VQQLAHDLYVSTLALSLATSRFGDAAIASNSQSARVKCLFHPQVSIIYWSQLSITYYTQSILICESIFSNDF
jgi:hypothetical protein